MIEFSKDHSSAWMEMMSAYQIFRAKLFDWAHEPDQKKQKDLLLELDSWENRDIHRRMLVVDLLRSTEMWDEKALLLVLKELTAIALQNKMRLPLMREWHCLKSKTRQSDLPLPMRCFVWQLSRAKRRNLILLYSTTAACCCMICTVKQSSHSMQIGMRI